MARCVKRYIRSEHNILADDHLAYIENRTVEIGIEIIPYSDIRSIIAAEGSLNMHKLPVLPKSLRISPSLSS